MASIFLRFPEGRAKALTLSYDDGVDQDIQLIEIMNRYGLKGTFNINSGLYSAEGTVHPQGAINRRMTEKQAVKTFRDSGQEVAIHSLTHPFLEQLPLPMIVKEIIQDRENLETQFGTIIRGMAYPYGRVSDSIVAALQAGGIVYARTVVSTYDFRIPNDWLRLAPTCHHNEPELDRLARKFVEDQVIQAPYLFYVWGHSYEFEAQNNWQIIENFAQYLGQRSDIWYATNIEINDYVEAYHRLVFSVDGQRVHNPSHRKIWFEHSGRMIAVEAGAMMEIATR